MFPVISRFLAVALASASLCVQAQTQIQQQPTAADQARAIATAAAKGAPAVGEGPACPGQRITTQTCVFELGGVGAGRVTAAANSTSGYIGAASAVCVDGRLVVREAVCESGGRDNHPRLSVRMDEILSSAAAPAPSAMDAPPVDQAAGQTLPVSNNIPGTALLTSQPAATYAPPAADECPAGAGKMVRWGADGRPTTTCVNEAPRAGLGPGGGGCPGNSNVAWRGVMPEHMCLGSPGGTVPEGGEVMISNTASGLSGMVIARCRGGSLSFDFNTATCLPG